jgi:steroid 5-alpha reductase family enzyme
VTPVVLSLLAGLLAVAAGMTIAGIRARQLDKAAVVDVAWGAGFVLVALVTAVVATVLDEGTPWRRWLVVAMVAAWGLRLAWHIRGRAVGEHGGQEDPRYAEMLGGPPSEIGMRTVVRRVFLVQGVVQWFIAWPVMIGSVLTVAWWPVVAAGVVVWATGLFFEAVGDRQLAAYKRQPKETRPPVMDRGLWRYTRHPNYFGDACIWWGLWLAAGLGSGWVAGLATVLCPAAMTFFVYQVTGVKLLEKTMMQRPGYPAYAARTSSFVPLPPRRS